MKNYPSHPFYIDKKNVMMITNYTNLLKTTFIGISIIPTYCLDELIKNKNFCFSTSLTNNNPQESLKGVSKFSHNIISIIIFLPIIRVFVFFDSSLDVAITLSFHLIFKLTAYLPTLPNSKILKIVTLTFSALAISAFSLYFFIPILITCICFILSVAAFTVLLTALNLICTYMYLPNFFFLY